MQQLSIQTYVEEGVFKREREALFNVRYVGHVSMVPNLYDYMVLPWDKSQFLYHSDNGIRLLSNVCQHRQALVFEGKGNSPKIVCNIHGWTYGQDGRLEAAPKFDELPCDRALQDTPLTKVGGLLFTGGDLPKDMFEGYDLEMSGFQFDSRDMVEYDFNWKTFLEVYGEDYHVDPFHPGLSNLVDTKELAWKMEEAYHVCTVGYQDKVRGGTPIYTEFQAQIKKFFGADYRPKYGAVWHFVYPNLMVEFYPGSMVIAYVHPVSAEKCQVFTEYFYAEEINCFEPEFKKIQKAAYEETTIEDDEICYRMHQGRKAIWLAGKNETGPYQPHLEAGMAEFHKFYNRKMNDHQRTIPISIG